MEFAIALGYAITALKTFADVEPALFKTIINAKPYVEALIQKFMGKPLSEDQRTELEAKLDEMHNEFQALKPDPEQ